MTLNDVGLIRHAAAFWRQLNIWRRILRHTERRYAFIVWYKCIQLGGIYDVFNTLLLLNISLSINGTFRLPSVPNVSQSRWENTIKKKHLIRSITIQNIFSKSRDHMSACHPNSFNDRTVGNNCRCHSNDTPPPLVQCVLNLGMRKTLINIIIIMLIDR